MKIPPHVLANHRHRLVRRLEHLEARVARRPPDQQSFDLAEASALKTALLLFDDAMARSARSTC